MRWLAVSVLLLSCGSSPSPAPQPGPAPLMPARGAAHIVVNAHGALGTFYTGPIHPAFVDANLARQAGALGCTKQPNWIGASAMSPEVHLVDGGTLQLTTRRMSLSLPFDPTAHQHRALSLLPIVGADEPVTVRGGGSPWAPAFQLASSAPPPVVLAEPAASAVLDRTRDVVLRWAPTRDGFVFVSVGTRQRMWSCIFDGPSGVGLVASALLVDEPAGELSLRVSAIRIVATDAGGFHTALSVNSEANETKYVLH